MPKQGRIEGGVEYSQYVIRGPQGVLKQIPLTEARGDRKLLSAIERNGWEGIPDGSE
jgi:hypothetical protein